MNTILVGSLARTLWFNWSLLAAHPCDRCSTRDNVDVSDSQSALLPILSRIHSCDSISSSQFPSGSFMNAILLEEPWRENGSMAIVTP